MEPTTSYFEVEILSQKRRIPLTSRVCRIGRNEDNTIVLPDEMASRYHVLLQASETGVWYLTDLGSTNGTTVNGVRVKAPVILCPGDHVQVGNHHFEFHRLQTAPPPALQTGTVLAVCSEAAGARLQDAGKPLQESGAVLHRSVGDALVAVWPHDGPKGHTDILLVFEALAVLRDVAAPIRAAIHTGTASHANLQRIAALASVATGPGCDLVLTSETFLGCGPPAETVRLFVEKSARLTDSYHPVPVYGTQLSFLERIVATLSASRGLGARTIVRIPV